MCGQDSPVIFYVLGEINVFLQLQLSKADYIYIYDTADAEIKAPSGENPEFKSSPFKAWSTSPYSHT